MRLNWPAKDPTEVLDYSIDWSSRLANDHITVSAFSITDANSSLTIIANSFTNTVTTVWLASGIAGRVGKVSNHVTTAAGREFEESIFLTIEDK